MHPSVEEDGVENKRGCILEKSPKNMGIWGKPDDLEGHRNTPRHLEKPSNILDLGNNKHIRDHICSNCVSNELLKLLFD